MVTITQEKLKQIEAVAELYLQRESNRRRAAQIQDSIRINDPVRYKAAQDKKFLVKTYYGCIGCTDDVLLDSEDEAVEYIRISAYNNGNDDEYSYRYFDSEGQESLVDIQWTPTVRLRHAN